MGKYVVEGSKKLKGSVDISGSKNSALPIMAAALLTEEECVLENMPTLRDINIMDSIMQSIAVETRFEKQNNIMRIKAGGAVYNADNNELMGKIRASFLTAGPLLSRFGRARISLPGGCSIGSRPIDLHLKGLAKLGAEISKEFGVVELKCKKLKGADIYLDFPSVGATENLIMAASLADGVTTVSNAAMEPEIGDLCTFLQKMGAEIYGKGTDTVRVVGSPGLKGAIHRIIPDRIEAGTFMLIGAACGEIRLNFVRTEHLRPIVAKLREAGAEVVEDGDAVVVKNTGCIKNTDIKTMPYPGFPTDMQPQFMSLMALGQGTGVINETIFENRFMQVNELNRMGADIKTEGSSAIIRGVKRLTGTNVRATDLRAGAALIISALAAEGTTEISDIYHIERGYCGIDEKLRHIGADIRRVDQG